MPLGTGFKRTVRTLIGHAILKLFVAWIWGAVVECRELVGSADKSRTPACLEHGGPEEIVLAGMTMIAHRAASSGPHSHC